jgi:hypothetical protein
MEKLYSYKGSYPYPLPTDVQNYNINDFVLAPEKPEITKGEILEWNGSSWIVRNPNEAEIDLKWQEIRNYRNILLANSDISVIRLYEEGKAVPIELSSYRQALRDITLQPDPFNISWPTL